MAQWRSLDEHVDVLVLILVRHRMGLPFLLRLMESRVLEKFHHLSGPPSSYGVGKYPVSSGSANSSIGPTTAWIAEAFSAVLHTVTPMRPFGARTRCASLATVSGLVKIWKPNRLTARSNVSSGKSIVSASITRNSTFGIRRLCAPSFAARIISSERS